MLELWGASEEQRRGRAVDVPKQGKALAHDIGMHTYIIEFVPTVSVPWQESDKGPFNNGMYEIPDTQKHSAPNTIKLKFLVGWIHVNYLSCRYF